MPRRNLRASLRRATTLLHSLNALLAEVVTLCRHALLLIGLATGAVFLITDPFEGSAPTVVLGALSQLIEHMRP